MRISTRGKYALEAMLYLGYSCRKEENLSLNTISEAAEISAGYLEQLFRSLKKNKLVVSKKGKYGGYCLSRPADEITVGDILISVEGPLALVKCTESENCERQDTCLTHRLWNVAYGRIKDTINTITLQTLIDDYQNRLEKAGAL